MNGNCIIVGTGRIICSYNTVCMQKHDEKASEIGTGKDWRTSGLRSASVRSFRGRGMSDRVTCDYRTSHSLVLQPKEDT